MKKYTIFETFVGAGGSHIGFKKAGFEAKYLNEIDPDCVATLKHNNKELKKTCFVDQKSILDIDCKTLLDQVNKITNSSMEKGDLDILFGGIVCKGFSLAGERSPSDERNYFYHKQLEIVKYVNPKISIIENVKGILNAKVLKPNTPKKIVEQVDNLWQSSEDYKGQKAELRKKGRITKEFTDSGDEIKRKKSELLKEIENKGYLISVMQDIRELYDSMGYNVQHKVLNTAWYGSSTKRERVIIVAVRKDIKQNFEYPIPEYNSEEINTPLNFDIDFKNQKFKKPKTIKDALSKIDYNKEDNDNIPMNHNEKTVARFKWIPEGGNIVDVLDKLPDDLVISKFYSRGNTMRLAMNKLAPTLVPGHSNFPVHPKEHRSITVREAGMITGFPYNYHFIGNHCKRCEHVGNAVPPQLAEVIGKQCVKLLEKHYSKLGK